MASNSKLTRRDFLRIVSAGTCGAAMHQVLSPMGQMMAFADPLGASLVPNLNKIFILVNLSGGASLSLFPLSQSYNPAWFDVMGGVAGLAYAPVGGESWAIDSRQMLNPGLDALAPIWAENRMALLNKVGFPNYTRSHSEDTNIWFRGGNSMGQGGWAPLLTNQMASIFAGISFGGSNLLITGDGNVPRSYGNLSTFGEGIYGSQGEQAKRLRDDLMILSPDLGTGNFALVKGAMDGITKSAELIKNATNKNVPQTPNSPLNFDNSSSFMRACHDTAKLINAPELGTQFVYLERGGWDTHSNARASVLANAQDVAKGLAALIAAAKLMGRWQDIVICTMSEFGRTYYNGRAGSTGFGDDHGHTSSIMVLGGGINGRIVNEPPTVADVNSSPGFLKGYDIAFWAVFQEIINWMGYDSTQIFKTPPPNGTYTNLNLFL